MQLNQKYRILISGLIILVTASWYPVDFLSELETRYQDYRKKYPFVRVHLTTHQPKYIPGDTVFFSVNYVLEDRQPISGMHLLHLDVVSDENQIVQRVRFKVKDGIGFNQFVLKGDLNPGVYKFLVYSDWMRNYGPDSFFQMDIPVVTKQQVALTPNQSSLLKIGAEGGHFIQGVENRVYAVGMPRQSIHLLDEAGAELQTVQLDEAGVGDFKITPSRNQRFQAKTEGTIVDLPAVEEDGIVLHIDSTPVWRATLILPEESRWKDQDVYLLVMAQGKFLLKREIRLTETKLSFELPTLSHTWEFHQVYILAGDGKELAQRIFLPEARKVKVQFRLQENVKQRDRFTFAVGVTEESGKLLDSDVSISILQQPLFDDRPSQHPVLQDLPVVGNWAQRVKSIDGYSLHGYLATQRWNRIPWEQVYNGQAPSFTYPFLGKISIIGRVIPKDDAKPIPDSTQVLAYLQKNAMGYEAFTKRGFFEMPFTFDFWDDDQLFFTLRRNGKSLDDTYQIKLVPDTMNLGLRWKSNTQREEDRYASYALKRNLIDQSYSYFSKGNAVSKSITSPNAILEEEFQGADYTIKLADYIVFPTMEELLHEVVSFVQIKRKGTEATVRLFYRYEQSVVFYKQDPIYIVDGVMTANTQFFLSLKPEALISLKVINNPNKLAQLGSLGQHGIIFVESKKGSLNDALQEALFPITGLSHPVSISETRWLQGVQPNQPSVRSSLYWNPSIKTNQSGYFETTLSVTDDLGPMVIRVQGLTHDGRHFYGEQEFRVEPNSNRH